MKKKSRKSEIRSATGKSLLHENKQRMGIHV